MSIYSLKVKEGFTHPDGRIFDPDHLCNSLDAFEVAELVTDYPDNFEAADEVTAELLQDEEKIAHLAEAVVRKKKEVGELKARKQ